MSEQSPVAGDSTGSEQFLRCRRFARECALQILYQADVQQEWEISNAVFDQYWEQLGTMESMPLECRPDQIKKLVEHQIQGLMAVRQEVDEQLQACAENWRIERMGVIDRNILRLAAYEIIHCSDIPPIASLNEALELAKEFGDKDSRRFVNGVLDKLLHETRKNNK